MTRRAAIDFMLFGAALVCFFGTEPYPSPDYRSAAMWVAGICVGVLFSRRAPAKPTDKGE